MDLSISCRETKDLLDAATPAPVFLDCREREEYDLVHIKGSILLPMSKIGDRIGELAGREEDHLIVYCHHGMRSAQVAQWLRTRGFPNVQTMDGGIDQWAEEIDPSLPRY
ncbi:rhodanese-like domain-containing protein [Aeoliella mucimassa]|uniref:Putative adenylyltransferase/sulfurtransferase MoeZ n=1 Tax=Aeoliella mucimassa TaxID=2527972 RepID=A0A518ATE5_9BACT|nr:rhodanese-like domain-containing protein [Aeoliella mucimassa]QDU57967.1 putative adenylyltransferase/sulfurtransferase MoeZ [Aeoliella mucimassa]